MIDFAWTASQDFRQVSRQVGEVEIVYLYLPDHAFTVERALNTTEAALLAFGEWFGEYPYERLTVVDVPEEGAGAGGMEYPTFFTSIPSPDRRMEWTIAHEVAHQWWQSVVATNEAEEPWLDEGFADYSTARFEEKALAGEVDLDLDEMKNSYLEMRRTSYLNFSRVPMYGTAWEFSPIEYVNAAYAKPALALTTLEGVLGEEVMLDVLSTYFEEYSFAHPTTEDFRRVAEEVSGEDLDWFFEGLVYDDEVVNYKVDSIDPHQAVVEREGNLEIPVEVEITFLGGETITETWDGSEGEVTYSYPTRPEIMSVEVDPDREIWVDQYWLDNQMEQEVDVRSLGDIIAQFLTRIHKAWFSR